MSNLGLTLKVKSMFFDRKAVIQEVGRANAKALSKAGAFVRRRARSSLRRRKKTSPAGAPPSVHSNDRVATLKNILFAYDRRTQSVVIGPVLLNGRPSGVSVPALHEFGGRIAVRQRTTRRARQPVIKSASYPPRPFMGPALQAEAPKFPSLWATNSKGEAA